MLNLFRRASPLQLTLLLSLSTLLLFALTQRNDSDADSASQQTPNLAVITSRAVQLQQFPLQRSFLGRVEADQNSLLGFELNGLISGVFVEEGSSVRSGDRLAQLDTQLLEQRQASARAAVEVAAAQLQLAQLSAARERETFARQLSSQQALDRAESQLRAAQAQRSAATAQLAAVATQIDKSQLRAPFDGVIADRYLDAGSVVSAGSAVLKILSQGPAEVKVSVAQSALPALPIGSLHTVVVAERHYSATVTAVAPENTAGTRGVTVLLQLQQPIGALLHGATATLVVEEQIEMAVFQLPITAMTESVRGLWAVYVAVPQSNNSDSLILDRRQVEVIHQSGDQVFVRGGLADQELVVVAGLQRLVPGQTVHLAGQSSSHE